MVIYVTKAGSDRKELEEILVEEGVTYQESPGGRDQELGSPLIEIKANLPEGNLDRIATSPPPEGR